ncbi:hypothetical protein JCM11491_003109 [Sporobolomyces phaffii]
MTVLVDYISEHLSRELAGTHSLSIQVVRSQPRRSYALFPHASNHKTCKIWQEEVLCVLNDASGASVVPVPVCAIEASVYTVPSTATSILYISKVDTTGLERPRPRRRRRAGPSPTKAFVSSFIAYHLEHPPHATTRVRVHVFARSQSQYLFPGSADNRDSKRVLDDKALIRWWKSTLSTAITTTSSPTSTVDAFYLVPGLTYLESLPYVPLDPAAAAAPPRWTYGHPYSTLSSPLHPLGSPPSTHPLPDHIPAFPDDPKSRFLHSLTSSSVAPSGSDGDYDDVRHDLVNLAFASGNPSTPHQRQQVVDRDRDRETNRLVHGVEGGVEEWWERMQFRQECCSGVLVGFFVVAIGERPPAAEPIKKDKDEVVDRKPTTTLAPSPYPASLPHATFTKLWTEFHNQDYGRANVDHLVAQLDKWSKDVRRLVHLEVEKGSVRAGEVEVKFTVENPDDDDARDGGDDDEETKKRRAAGETVPSDVAEVKKINTLAPRKKKKVV